MKRLSILLLAGAVLLPLPANANMERGAGANTCGTWLANRDRYGGNRHLGMLSWALGYLSARYVEDPLKTADGNAVLYWLDNYCQARPTIGFSEALEAFVNEQLMQRSR